MKHYCFKKQILLPVSKKEAWAFFSNPSNLKKITPPEMGVRILSKGLPANIYSGLEIEYRLAPLFGVPLRWSSRILDVRQPEFFIDEQQNGPYAFWKHEHRFESHAKGTLMTDTMAYGMPFSWLGSLAHALIVKRKLKHIFDYRSAAIAGLFPVTTPAIV